MADLHTNDDPLIKKYLNNQLDNDDFLQFNEKLKEQQFRENLFLAKILHLGQKEKKAPQNPMEAALGIFEQIQDEIQATHPIKLSQDDALFLASLKNNTSEEALIEYFDDSEALQYEEWASSDSFVEEEIQRDTRSTNSIQETPTFDLLFPENRDHFENQLNIQLKTPLPTDIHIFLYDNYRYAPPSLKEEIPIILAAGQTEKNINITSCASGRYYIKLEAQGFSKIMRIIWII